ncbi:MAG: NAD(P)-dependent oxidoreductase [Bacteroidota bacterium]
MIKNIAFIGLGNMVFPMAKRLCNAGFSVRTAVHHNVEKARQLAAENATIADALVEAVRGADLVITILPQDQQVKEVLLNPEVYQVIVGQPSTIIMEMTSCSPQTVQKVGEEYSKTGIRVFDAPVSGGTAGAANGSLTIFGSGDRELLNELKPVLDVLATKVYHVGELGAGKALKAINQMMAAVNMVTIAEALAVAEKEGINPDAMYDVIKESSGNSYVFDKKFKNTVSGSFAAGFKTALMRKDLEIALGLGEGLELPLAKLAYEY